MVKTIPSVCGRDSNKGKVYEEQNFNADRKNNK